MNKLNKAVKQYGSISGTEDKIAAKNFKHVKATSIGF